MTRSPCREESHGVMGLLAIPTILMLSCICMGCAGGPDSYPTPPFPIEELLVDQSVLPGDWQVHEGTFNPRQRLPAEQIAVSFGIDGCASYSLGGSHYVYRFFDSAESAARWYRYKITIWFAPTEGWGTWSVPAELSYQSPVAHQFRFDCSTHHGSSVQTCQAVGQYKEYVVRFHTTIDPQHPECMSFADLERILVAIDERMALYLGKGME